uniref:Uncharacterized protein n=1 Tax=Avena sativa TaxID=4498 RepID=A0ACD5Z7J0_AVESA
MSFSRPTVHPVQAPPPQAQGDANAAPFGVRMKKSQGTPGTLGGLGLRLAQASFAAASIATMASTHVFSSVSAFRYLVAAAILQCLWSLVLALVEIYAILVKRSVMNLKAAGISSVGDGITGSLTFSAACASAGVTALIGSDVEMCAGNSCARFMAAVAMAFLSWFALAPSFLFNFAFTASRLAALSR